VRSGSRDAADFDDVGLDPDLAADQEVAYARSGAALIDRRGIDLRPWRAGGELDSVILGDDGDRPVTGDTARRLASPDLLAAA
jgi:hypothetical protein